MAHQHLRLERHEITTAVQRKVEELRAVIHEDHPEWIGLQLTLDNIHTERPPTYDVIREEP